MRIRNADDAESVVRKYFLGTRTFHGKIASISAEEKTEGPDEKGTWKVKGTHRTDAGVGTQFTVTVSSRGEVRMISTNSTKAKRQFNKGSLRHKLSNTDYAARRRRRKKQRPGRRKRPRRGTT